MADGKARRGRPRDPAAQRAIREATLELLDEKGYQGVTMAAVAERAGMAKTTIYRRWPTKAQMVLDAIAGDVEIRDIDTKGDPLSNLQSVMKAFYRLAQGDGRLPLSPVELLREADVGEAFYDRLLAPLRSRAIALVERAIDEGSIRSDVDPAELVDIMMGVGIYKSLTMGARPDPDLAARVFGIVMEGALTGDRPSRSKDFLPPSKGITNGQ
jgi:AcrR family transcriptional regulator